VSDGPTSDRHVAAVDIGSNSMRILKATGLGPSGPIGERLTSIIGLKRGAADDGTLADDALQRLDDCMVEFGSHLPDLKPEHILVIATSATRDAPNRDRVAAIIKRRLGAELTVVSGPEEAALGFAGARLAAPDQESTLVLDIGGGSTEFSCGTKDGPDRTVSLQIGSVRDTDRYLLSDPPTADEVADLRAGARAVLAAAVADFPRSEGVIGVAGTITSLAAIDLGGYDPEAVHGHELTLEKVDELTEELAAMTLEERRKVCGLHPDRAPAIVAGSAILGEAMRAFGVDRLTVSERDLLDGAAMRAYAELDSSG
jgi:exopolyphosphatase/guanosine-5'-triphosphate,3'-diphosphate pyrophosphatase